MTTKEQALSKVKALVPELMELSFGCRVQHELNESNTIFIQKFENEEHNFIGYEPETSSTDKQEDLDSGEWEILGHTVQLHHVLKAFDKVYNLRFGELAKCDNCESSIHPLATHLIDLYDLTKDAEHQSEEFYDLLNEIL